jgi:UDP-glucose 4-epimerase
MFNLFFILISIFLLATPQLPAEGQKEEPSYVLVVGGAGFIGSYINEMLYQQGYQTLVFDNLSKGDRRAIHHGIFIPGDLSNKELLDKIFTTYPIMAVMHFAASTSVKESIENPLKYYINNVANTLNLLEAMLQHNVKKIIFSSSAAIFGMTEVEEIREEQIPQPINPYGRTKLIGEMILQDLNAADSLAYISLRYFNVAGGNPNGKYKNYEKNPRNLIPIILKSLKNSDASVEIFGTDYPTPDGTCIRDYIHVEDIGTAHIKALELLMSGHPSSSYNLGNGQGFSVKEVIAAVERITGYKIRIIERPRREGDSARIIANSDKARHELKWQPKYSSLDTIIQHAWNAMQDNEF